MPEVAAQAARFLHHACRAQKAEPPTTLEASLAHFGARLLSPEMTIDEHDFDLVGEQMYQGYVEGKITRAAIRRLFLSTQRATS